MCNRSDITQSRVHRSVSDSNVALSAPTNRTRSLHSPERYMTKYELRSTQKDSHFLIQLLVRNCLILFCHTCRPPRYSGLFIAAVQSPSIRIK